MPMIHEESPRSLQRTRTRENKNKAPPVLTARPRRTIAQAQYKQKQAALNRATPTKYPSPTNKGPRYITQDDEEELANLLFNEALPNIVKTNQLTSEDAEHNQANLLHTKLYQKSMPKTQLHNLKTPLGINSQAVIKLMGTHLENPHHHCFIPGTFQNSTISLTHKCKFDEPVANGVVHPVTKETITKYEKLANDPVMKDVWTKAMCKELGRLAQGYGDKKGTNTIFFMSIEEI
jgi:hypothetical protein